MKALILVGGYGTRLRPLTLTCPKPAVEFCNKPLLVHQIEALEKVGVNEVILAVSRCADKSDTLEAELKKYNLGVLLHFSYEDEAMGTAGPIALARSYLLNNPSAFFVLNSDIMCEFPFQELIQFHEGHGKEASIFVTQVTEPSKYGVVVHNPETGLVDCFIEKPIEFCGDKINAGIYLLNPSIVDKVPRRPTSIEKEIFPRLAETNQLYCLALKGFWMDVGQPKDFLAGTQLCLAHMAVVRPSELAEGPNIRPDVLIHPSAKVSPTCILGPSVVVGPDCEIRDGARISNSTLLQGSSVGSHSWLSNCIIGWRSSIGDWVRMENTCVLGEDVVVSDELFINGARVLPHKSINQSILDPQIIM